MGELERRKEILQELAKLKIKGLGMRWPESMSHWVTEGKSRRFNAGECLKKKQIMIIKLPYLPTTTVEKYKGSAIKWDNRAPWQPSTFHLAILSLHDMLSVRSPRPGLVLSSPTVWYLDAGARGSCRSPGTHFAPVLYTSLMPLSRYHGRKPSHLHYLSLFMMKVS